MKTVFYFWYFRIFFVKQQCEADAVKLITLGHMQGPEVRVAFWSVVKPGQQNVVGKTGGYEEEEGSNNTLCPC